MKQISVLLSLLMLAACATTKTTSAVKGQIEAEMDAAVSNASPQKVFDALLPPLPSAAPPSVVASEAKFDLVVNNTPAREVFLAIVSGTRYSMLLHPAVDGFISVKLKDVTVLEALEAIREMYGYEYKIEGTRIYIQPLGLQTRIFRVNYLTGQRAGKSSLRVTSSSISNAPITQTNPTLTNPTLTNVVRNTTASDGSQVSMTSDTDFWQELEASLKAIVGNEGGRSVVVSPLSGVVVVRAMPDELKNVAAYLKASQLSVERQVILEAKIIEVQLNDAFQSGVNWAAFKNNPNSHLSVGQGAAGSTLVPGGATANLLTGDALSAMPGSSLLPVPATSLPSGMTAGTLFGLAFQTSNFATLLNFLESQGNVHVLSSPRIATLNNQKAVLKVGVDEFFVTNVSTTTTTGTATTSIPSVTLQPFFSGIALDVTPRIDENDDIILHVHPSVSQVSTVNKTVDIGGVGGKLNLPLASSSVSETDSIVRAKNGQIVAIGGLMRQASFDDQSGLPGLPKNVFGQTNRRSEKRELVILLKPTIVSSENDWKDDITRSRDRIKAMNR